MSITVYTTSNCLQCRFTEKRMAERDLTFSIVRLEEDPRAAARLRDQGFFQAPVVEVTGNPRPQMWSGFQPDLIDSLHNS